MDTEIFKSVAKHCLEQHFETVEELCENIIQDYHAIAQAKAQIEEENDKDEFFFFTF